MPSHTHSGLKLLNQGYVDGGTQTILGSNNGYTVNNDTEATGGGQAHNNMPPYIVTYMWKRTA